MDVIDIINEAKQLPAEDREQIAHAMHISLEGDVERADDIDPAWSAEIKRRVDEVMSGKAKLIPADEAESFIAHKKRFDERFNV